MGEGEGHGGCPSPSYSVFEKGTPHLKRKSPPTEKQTTSLHWKVKPPLWKWFQEKNTKNQKLSLIVLHLKNNTKKMTKIPQKYYFLTWSIENVIWKVKQFIRKYIIWLTDLANKLYEAERILISFYAMFFFIKKFGKQTCWIKFNLITYKLTCGCLD